KDQTKKDEITKDDVKNDKRNGRQRDSQQRVSGDSGEFPFSVLAKTMRRVLQDYGERILVKSPNHGCLELRSAICLYLGRSKGLVVNPSQVIVGSGAEYLYGLIVQLLGTDRIYALENPSYRKIQEVYEAMGASCDLLTLGPDGIATGELERTKAQILHVTPFNSYPSGITAGISKKHEYLRWAKRRGGILIEDNYDSELTVSRKAEEPLYSMDADADVVYLNTFSRTVAPSMRVGYMILPARMLDDFDRKLGFYSCTVPIFDQYVLAELLQSGDFERHINRVRREKRKQLSSGQFFPR
ncbi:MAG: PLP-dependent aminotransferase family protein, partial [Eubacteriales bacterium]|nr:PLP-dependent aminotransferase family protein [Eubacteriales bacterium]